MRFPGFIEEIGTESNRWKLLWGVRSGYFMAVCLVIFALFFDVYGLLPTKWLYALFPLKILTNTMMWAGIKTRRYTIPASSINIFTDGFIFTVIVYFTGGRLSQLFPLYFIEIAIVSLLSNLGITILVGIGCLVLYGTMGALQYMGILPPQPASIAPILKGGGLTLSFLLLNFFSLAFVLGVTTFAAASILRLLGEKERALEAKTHELEEAGRLKSELMRNITHEFRTPIHGTLGLTALMEDRVYGPITEKQKEALLGITTCTQNLLRLVDDLLDLARSEAKSMEVFPSKVKVHEVATSAVSTARWIQGKKKLDIVVDVPQDLPELVTDRGKLLHILINLLSNAIKFTPEGGKVCVRARGNNAASVEISVEDTGIGISQKDLPSIFDEFRQVDGSMSRPYRGAGLGLSLVKKLTELLGGQVSVESTPGKGSTFTVRLPLRYQ